MQLLMGASASVDVVLEQIGHSIEDWFAMQIEKQNRNL